MVQPQLALPGVRTAPKSVLDTQRVVASFDLFKFDGYSTISGFECFPNSRVAIGTLQNNLRFATIHAGEFGTSFAPLMAGRVQNDHFSYVSPFERCPINTGSGLVLVGAMVAIDGLTSQFEKKFGDKTSTVELKYQISAYAQGGFSLPDFRTTFSEYQNISTYLPNRDPVGTFLVRVKISDQEMSFRVRSIAFSYESSPQYNNTVIRAEYDDFVFSIQNGLFLPARAKLATTKKDYSVEPHSRRVSGNERNRINHLPLNTQGEKVINDQGLNLALLGTFFGVKSLSAPDSSMILSMIMDAVLNSKPLDYKKIFAFAE